MRTLARLLVTLLALIGLVAVIALAWLGRGGISARAEPGPLETRIARALRSLAIPGDAANRANPIEQTPETLRSGLEHYAEHCAVCHGSDGSGGTEIGRGLYPRPPDLRAAGTQALSDGELFYIIENGVRFTGMPAWSTEGETENWHLVQFIRRLPGITDAEIKQVEALSPATRGGTGGGHEH
jgi:mono/diheme cytochrome c family protein